MAHMQNSLFGEDGETDESLESLTMKFTDQDYIEMLEDDLEKEQMYSREAFGHLAVSFDFIGQMAISLAKNSDSAITKEEILNSVDTLFASMPIEQRQAIRDAVDFHFYANNLKSSFPKGSVDWRQMYSVSNLGELDFDLVINTYFTNALPHH